MCQRYRQMLLDTTTPSSGWKWTTETYRLDIQRRHQTETRDFNTNLNLNIIIDCAAVSKIRIPFSTNSAAHSRVNNRAVGITSYLTKLCRRTSNAVYTAGTGPISSIRAAKAKPTRVDLWSSNNPPNINAPQAKFHVSNRTGGNPALSSPANQSYHVKG